MPRPGRYASIHPITAATDTRTAITPVARLSKAALNVFNLTVSRHEHLRPSDAVLLTAYSQTAALVLAGKGDNRQLERLGRLLIAYGRALRINGVQAVKPPKPHNPGGFGVTWQQLQDDDDEGGDDDDDA